MAPPAAGEQHGRYVNSPKAECLFSPKAECLLKDGFSFLFLPVGSGHCMRPAGLIRMCRMNASNAAITVFTVHRRVPLLPVVSHDGPMNWASVAQSSDNMPAERPSVTEVKQIEVNSRTTIPCSSTGKRKLANTGQTVVNVSQLVACPRQKVNCEKVESHHQNILKHFCGKRSWGVTNIAPRFIRVNPKCEVRGKLAQHSHIATCFRVQRKMRKGVAE